MMGGLHTDQGKNSLQMSFRKPVLSLSKYPLRNPNGVISTSRWDFSLQSLP